MSQDYGPASETLTTHHDGWGIFQPKWIIVHGTAGFQTAQQVADYFLSNNPPSSTHFVVGQDGAVVQCVRESQAAWGNGPITGPAGTGGDGVHHDAWWDSVPQGNPNTVTFSIEHVKPHTDNSDVLTPAQQAASFALIKHLCEAHNIPKRAADASGGITGHFSMDPVNRSMCPGPYPWAQLWAYLNGGSGMAGVPSGWHDDGTTLTAPNGNNVVLGFRSYVLTHPWAAEDQPLENEHWVDQTEWHAQLGAGSKQIFLRTVLRYNPTREGHVMQSDAGAEVHALEQKVADLQAQLATSQQQQAEDENIAGAVVDLNQLQQTVQQLVTDALAKLKEPAGG